MKKEWSAGCLSSHDFDERERLTSLAQRDALVRSSGLFESVKQKFTYLKLMNFLINKKNSFCRFLKRFINKNY